MEPILGIIPLVLAVAYFANFNGRSTGELEGYNKGEKEGYVQGYKDAKEGKEPEYITRMNYLVPTVVYTREKDLT